MGSEALVQGFLVAVQPSNLLFLFLGVLVGTLVGVLPGLGPATSVSLLIPLTYDMDPATALIMMAGVYYGAMYGGSTTAILVNTPGEAGSVVTTLDGYQMARQGRAGAALAISAIASFIAGTLGTVLLSVLAVPLAGLSVQFGPAESFALMLFALVTTSSLSGDSPLKGLMAMVAGLMIATVGVDLQTGTPRFTFGSNNLLEGIDFIVVVVGLFAVGEVLANYQDLPRSAGERIRLQGRLWITREDWRRSWRPILRGSLVGFFVGVLPGAGASVAAIIDYGLGKRFGRERDRLGTGAIEGVAGPEAANNGAAVGSMVPMLSLGIPGSNTTAVMLGALMMYGLRPGPFLFEQNPKLVWGLINSMYVGNVMLLLLNLPLVGIFARLLNIPPRILLPLILGISFAGVYATHQSVLDLWLVVLFGVIGLGMRKAGVPTAPLVLAVVLGGTLEQSFRQSLQISMGSPLIFVTEPLALALMLLTGISAVLPPLLAWGKRNRPRARGRQVAVSPDR